MTSDPWETQSETPQATSDPWGGDNGASATSPTDPFSTGPKADKDPWETLGMYKRRKTLLLKEKTILLSDLTRAPEVFDLLPIRQKYSPIFVLYSLVFIPTLC